MPRIAVLLALALSIAACGPPPVAPIKPEDQKFTQPFTLRVLDAKDRPVEGAKLTLIAKNGAPQSPAQVQTDRQGEAAIAWRPQVVNHTAGSHSRDEVFDLKSRIEYVIAKEGFFPARGAVEAVARGRRLYDPNLKPLSREPVLALKSETVILHRLTEVFGGELGGRPQSDPLIKKLTAFHKDMALVAPHLGVEFAWPAFVLEGQKLGLRLAWRGASWASLGHAPLLAQVTASAILPFARAVGEELPGLGGVKDVAITVQSETPPADDPYALPEINRITLRAPLSACKLLAKNQTTPDDFLVKYPPTLSVEKPPRSADSAAPAPPQMNPAPPQGNPAPPQMNPAAGAR